MAAELNAGDSAQTKHKIDDAKVLRLKLLKMAETVDAVSKRIAGLELVVNEDQDESVAVVDPVTLGSYTTLKSRIRMASVNFVKVIFHNAATTFPFLVLIFTKTQLRTPRS